MTCLESPNARGARSTSMTAPSIRTPSASPAARASGTGTKPARATRHAPGVQSADVQELIDHGVEVVVLSVGVYERLQVRPETLQALHDHGIDVFVEQTEAAVDRYNQLVDEGRAVGALIHSTC